MGIFIGKPDIDENSGTDKTAAFFSFRLRMGNFGLLFVAGTKIRLEMSESRHLGLLLLSICLCSIPVLISCDALVEFRKSLPKFRIIGGVSAEGTLPWTIYIYIVSTACVCFRQFISCRRLNDIVSLVPRSEWRDVHWCACVKPVRCHRLSLHRGRKQNLRDHNCQRQFFRPIR